MVKFPMKFEVIAAASSGMGTPWTSQTDQFPPIPCAVPAEFMGPGGAYSPEDLFALSILNCIIATFKVYAEKGKVSFKTIKGKAQLTVDKLVDQPGFGMTHIDIALDIENASDPERVRHVLEHAIKDCAVSNSIKTGKTFHINVS